MFRTTVGIGAALNKNPSKLFVETTARCNLRCAMCVKQSATGGKSEEGDLSFALFEAMEPAFPTLDALILNGIGEPLLHPRLEEFVAAARNKMPDAGWIGFQTNGLLLDAPRALALADAGLNRICLSVDAVSPETFRSIREGGELRAVGRALDALASVNRQSKGSGIAAGIEFVVRRDNLRQLPEALRWAAGRGASFAIVSHMLPYDPAHVGQAAYGTCTGEALAIFQDWKGRAARSGVALERYFDILWKYDKTPEEKRIVKWVDEMKAQALRQGVALDVKKLLAEDPEGHQEILAVFEEARAAARESGLDLRLPAAAPQEARSCRFIEEGGAFISWDGKVHPCYYLWHHSCAFAGGWRREVKPKVFGSLDGEGLLEIWNGEAFRRFRHNALRADFPFCPGCNLAPCDYVQGEDFEQDCFVNEEPCGACLWGAGLFQCLG